MVESVTDDLPREEIEARMNAGLKRALQTPAKGKPLARVRRVAKEAGAPGLA